MSNVKNMEITYKLTQIKDLIKIGDYIKPENQIAWYQVTAVAPIGFAYHNSNNSDTTITFDGSNDNTRYCWIAKDLMELAAGFSSGRVAVYNTKKEQSKYRIEDI